MLHKESNLTYSIPCCILNLVITEVKDTVHTVFIRIMKQCVSDSSAFFNKSLTDNNNDSKRN